MVYLNKKKDKWILTITIRYTMEWCILITKIYDSIAVAPNDIQSRQAIQYMPLLLTVLLIEAAVTHPGTNPSRCSLT